MRYAVAYFTAVLAVAFYVGTAKAATPAPDTPADQQPLVVVRQPEVAVLASRVAYWKRKAAAARARARALHRELLHQPSVEEALNLACVVYGNCQTLWRRARCESHLYAYARNPSGASGLLQFLPSTWRSTPYAGFSVFSPYANALAAGWMIGPAGRGGEWECR